MSIQAHFLIFHRLFKEPTCFLHSIFILFFKHSQILYCQFILRPFFILLFSSFLPHSSVFTIFLLTSGNFFFKSELSILSLAAAACFSCIHTHLSPFLTLFLLTLLPKQSQSAALKLPLGRPFLFSCLPWHSHSSSLCSCILTQLLLTLL